MVGGLAATVVSGQQTEMQHDEPPIQTLERYSESLLVSLEAAERGRLHNLLPEDYVSPWPRMPGVCQHFAIFPVSTFCKRGNTRFCLAAFS